MAETRCWTLTIPAPARWLSMNDSGEWDIIRRKKLWREAAFVAALRARPPKGLDRVRVDTLFRFAGRKPVHEIENLRLTLKSAVDGAIGPQRKTAVGYGIVPDDSDRHLEYGHYIYEVGDHTRRHPAAMPCMCGALVLTITEVTG